MLIICLAALLPENFCWRLAVGYCPECDAEIPEEFEDIGEIITCPECGIDLEVISLDPVEFDLAPVDDEEDEDEDFNLDEDEEDEEDWDDDESLDDDEEDDYS
jgi:alpha-aminoadipate carrier protein LysW